MLQELWLHTSESQRWEGGGPRAISRQSFSYSSCRQLKHTPQLLHHVHVVSHYIQLNVSSTPLLLTKSPNSPNHPNATPQECVTESSLSGKRAVNTPLGHLPGPQKEPAQERGPFNFHFHLCQSIFECFFSSGSLLRKSYSLPFFLPPSFPLSSSNIYLVHTIFQTPCWERQDIYDDVYNTGIKLWITKAVKSKIYWLSR